MYFRRKTVYIPGTHFALHHPASFLVHQRTHATHANCSGFGERRIFRTQSKLHIGDRRYNSSYAFLGIRRNAFKATHTWPNLGVTLRSPSGTSSPSCSWRALRTRKSIVYQYVRGHTCEHCIVFMQCTCHNYTRTMCLVRVALHSLLLAT